MKTVIIFSFLFIVTLLAQASCIASSGDADNAFLFGKKLSGSGHMQEAITQFSKAIKLNPATASYYAERGWCYAMKGYRKLAFADFTKAITIDPDCSNAFSYRGELNAAIGFKKKSQEDCNKALSIGISPIDTMGFLNRGRVYSTLGREKDAGKDFEQALKVIGSSSGAGTYYQKAICEFCFKHSTEALADVNNAIKLESLNPDYIFLRGLIYSSDGKTQEAVSDYTQVLKITPDNLGAKYNRACNYMTLGKNDLAIKELNDDIAYEPCPNNLIKRANYFEAKEDYATAVKDTTQAITIDPDDVKAYITRGYEYCHLKKLKQALKDLNQALVLDPKSAWAFYQRGVAYSDLGEMDKAINDLSKAIALQPQAGAFYSRAYTYREKKDYKRAIEDYTSAIRLDPTALDYCGRGCSYRFEGQYDKAIQDCTKAIALDSHRTHSYLTRGVSYAKLKQFDKSLQDLNMAIKQSPRFGEAYYERSLVYKQLGNYKSAEADANEAKKLHFKSCLH